MRWFITMFLVHGSIILGYLGFPDVRVHEEA